MPWPSVKLTCEGLNRARRRRKRVGEALKLLRGLTHVLVEPSQRRVEIGPRLHLNHAAVLALAVARLPCAAVGPFGELVAVAATDHPGDALPDSLLGSARDAGEVVARPVGEIVEEADEEDRKLSKEVADGLVDDDEDVPQAFTTCWSVIHQTAFRVGMVGVGASSRN